MAQNITLLGASYSDVPSILLPKKGGGQASFTDVTDTTATASDVASGKYFYAADGTRTLGTNSGGGGGGEVKVGVLRPDAELVQTASLDAMLVDDLGISIPSYNTSTQTLRAGANVISYSFSPDAHRYYITIRTLTIPIYNITTKAKGREEYIYSTSGYEFIYQPAGSFRTMDGSIVSGSVRRIIQANGSQSVYVYCNSATSIATSTNLYGVRQYILTPSVSFSSSTATINISDPNIQISGSTTYLTSTYWNAMTDVRVQYIIQLWRVPVGDTVPNGWVNGTQLESLDKDIANGGTLT